MTVAYAGIGSRKTPQDILVLMYKAASALTHQGYILRSGGASGADSAFERGAWLANPRSFEIFVPWRNFNGRDSWNRGDIVYKCNVPQCIAAMELAEKYHPNWAACSSAARRFHARNMFQILGRSLNDPVKFVICWTPDGKRSGGTGQALRVAEDKGIPIYDLAIDEQRAAAVTLAGLVPY